MNIDSKITAYKYIKQKMDSKFDYAKVASDLPVPRTTHKGYQQISATRSLAGGQFSNGMIQFPFQFGANQYVDFQRSFLRFRIKLEDGKAGLQEESKDATADANALCMNACSTFFNSVSLRIGGKVVSSCSNFVSQCSTLQERLTRTKEWMDSVGVSARLMDPSFHKRKYLTSTRTVQDTQVAAYGETLTDYETPAGVKEIEICWQPPLGLFKLAQVIPANAQMILECNPAPMSDIRVKAIETRDPLRTRVNLSVTNTGASPATGYFFDITECHFYVYVLDGDRIGDTSIFLKTNEIICQSAAHATSSATSHYLTVPATTDALTVAFQNASSGTNQNYSPTVFKNCYSHLNDGKDLSRGLTDLDVSYAGRNLVSYRFDSDYVVSSKDFAGMNYEMAMLQLNANTESKREWLQRGPFYHIEIDTDSTTRATSAVVGARFTADAAPTNGTILVFSHYTQVLQLDFVQGILKEIKIQTA